MLRLRTLGESIIEVGATRLGPDSEILFCLLAYLIVERGRLISRSALVELLWESDDDIKARHCLRQSIYKLRRLGAPIETRHEQYMLPAGSGIADYEDGSWDLDALLERASADSATVLPGLNGHSAGLLSRWIETVRDRASESLRSRLLVAMTDARQRSDSRSAAGLARFLLSVDPLNEEGTLVLAEHTALTGRKRDAVQMLDDYMRDLGARHEAIKLPATVLRNRIAERVAYTTAGSSAQGVLVGRDDSMRLLGALSREVGEGAGHVCVICGDPGIGKTRLVNEFANVSAMRGHRVLRTACQADTETRAFSIFMRLVPQILRLPGALGCSPRALALARRVGEHDSTAQSDTENVGELSGLHAALVEAVCELLDAVTAERPLTLVVEDIHWLDDVSRAALCAVASSNRDRSLFLLLTSRNDDHARSICGPDRRQVIIHHLETLSDVDAHALALNLCETMRVQMPQPALSWCVGHASGNPLFLVELVAHWRDTRDMTRVPATLEALIEQRLGKLSCAAMQTLQAVALLGQHASYERLEVLLGLPRWQLQSALDELENSGATAATIDRVTVRHDLLAQSVTSRLTSTGARLLHRAIARSLEADAPTVEASAHMWDAATHWAASGDNQRALALAKRCATHLMSIGLAHEAADLLQRAFIFAGSDEDKLDLFEARGECLSQAWACQELLENSESAIPLLRATRQGHEAIHSVHELTLLKAQYGLCNGTGAPMLSRALKCASDRSATPTHRLEAAYWGLAMGYLDSTETGSRAVLESVADIRPENIQDRRYYLICQLIYLTGFGDLHQALEAGDQLLELEKQHGSSQSLARAFNISANPYRLLGNWSMAFSRTTESREIARAHGLHGAHNNALMGLAQIHCNLSEWDGAWACISEAEARADRQAWLTDPYLHITAAEIALMRGDVPAAQQRLARLKQTSDVPVRYESDVLALSLVLASHLNAAVDLASTTRLLELHTTLMSRSGHDFACGALCAALASSSKDGMIRAQHIAEEYVRVHRRERWPTTNKVLLRLLHDQHLNEESKDAAAGDTVE